MRTETEQRPTARISIAVTDFQEIGRGDGCSSADVELTDTGNGNVFQSGVNAPIEVRAEVYLEFSVTSRSGDNHGYLPIGIGFKGMPAHPSRKAAIRQGDGCEHGDLLGSAAFPMRTHASKGNAAQLTVLDANPAPAEFKYSLFIQRSDGALSVIDPKIKNTGVPQ